MGALDTLVSTHNGPGTLRLILLRTDRKGPMQTVDRADVTETGLIGDHRATPGKRAVTLIQWEHLPVIAALMGHGGAPDHIAALTRRNLVISGINLIALRKSAFRIGSVVLQATGPCAPCRRMEGAFGPGGFNAVRGHGGLTAEVLSAGTLALGDPLVPVQNTA